VRVYYFQTGVLQGSDPGGDVRYLRHSKQK
jgi:hypothetical protein